MFDKQQYDPTMDPTMIPRQLRAKTPKSKGKQKKKRTPSGTAAKAAKSLKARSMKKQKKIYGEYPKGFFSKTDSPTGRKAVIDIIYSGDESAFLERETTHKNTHATSKGLFKCNKRAKRSITCCCKKTKPNITSINTNTFWQTANVCNAS